MGLLDDAIREHLELKRLRGADPGVVAREEQDALGPVPRRRGDGAYGDEDEDELGAAIHDDGGILPASDSSPTADSVSVGQETVELNMEAELASEGDIDSHSIADRDASARPVVHPASARAISDESLEWEVPDDAEGPSERAEFDDEQHPDAGEDPSQAELPEDVLEETPDFLRETPEQERLWFEQRPPRDFDFNE
ncbi:MAG TPA: hypothetical protein VGP18_08600 [Solirubrobacteraceae bacterium]|jgi:hypothetical protein|nr:hypothetical protein [Solirubrobacteraceae bacterium]